MVTPGAIFLLAAPRRPFRKVGKLFGKLGEEGDAAGRTHVHRLICIVSINDG